MNIVTQVLDRLRAGSFAEAIYHYTSPNGLIGIVRDRALWATDVRYLNDSQEFTYTIALARELLEGLRVKAPKDAVEALDECERALLSVQSIHVYVASFSANGDLLSQWRAYCPAPGGFSLGFPPLAVANVARCNVLPCVYDKDVQQRLLSFVVSLWIKQRRAPLDYQEARYQQYRRERDLELAFLLLAAVFKHSGFQEEQEWRLVRYHRLQSVPYEKMRTGRSGLVPYVELPLVQPQYPMWLRRVVVGPNPHQRLAESALRALLGNARIIYDDFKRSRIPYRSW